MSQSKMLRTKPVECVYYSFIQVRCEMDGWTERQTPVWKDVLVVADSLDIMFSQGPAMLETSGGQGSPSISRYTPLELLLGRRDIDDF